MENIETSKNILNSLNENIEATTKKRTRGLGKAKKLITIKRHFDFTQEVIDALNLQVNYYGKNQSATLALIILKNAKDIEKEELNLRKIQSLDFAELLARQAKNLADLEDIVNKLNSEFDSYKNSIDGKIEGSLETSINTVHKAAKQNLQQSIAQLKTEFNVDKINLLVDYATATTQNLRDEAKAQLRKLG